MGAARGCAGAGVAMTGTAVPTRSTAATTGPHAGGTAAAFVLVVSRGSAAHNHGCGDPMGDGDRLQVAGLAAGDLGEQLDDDVEVLLCGPALAVVGGGLFELNAVETGNVLVGRGLGRVGLIVVCAKLGAGGGIGGGNGTDGSYRHRARESPEIAGGVG